MADDLTNLGGPKPRRGRPPRALWTLLLLLALAAAAFWLIYKAGQARLRELQKGRDVPESRLSVDPAQGAPFGALALVREIEGSTEAPRPGAREARKGARGRSKPPSAQKDVSVETSG